MNASDVALKEMLGKEVWVLAQAGALSCGKSADGISYFKEADPQGNAVPMIRQSFPAVLVGYDDSSYVVEFGVESKNASGPVTFINQAVLPRMTTTLAHVSDVKQKSVLVMP